MAWPKFSAKAKKSKFFEFDAGTKNLVTAIHATYNIDN